MSTRETVLIVEDNIVNRKILEKILSDEYRVLQASNGAEGVAMLHQHGDDITAVILDLIMPVMNGFEFLKVVYEIEAFQTLPIIVSSEKDSEEHETKVLSMGAWDFISKPYNPQILKFRLKNAIERSQLSAFHQLKYLAEFDTLTGLYNKTKFFAATREMLYENPDLTFAFIRFDIDRFQLVNSFFGVEEGDRLLCYLAKEFKNMLRNNAHCTYGRMEADIFVCCLEYHEKERLMKALQQTQSMVRSYNLSFDIVPTIGIYFLDDHSLPINVILDRATLASKTRKGSYIDIIGEYVPEMSLKIAQEQEIVNEMVYALEQEQFEIYIQPKYSLSNNMPSGGEALVRWIHPEKGILSPGIFIPVFEKNGFISKLDYYVWERVCQLFRHWIDHGISSPHPISVNVSRVNLYNPQIVERICALIERYQIQPYLLELELTESAYTDNPVIMRQVVERLRQKGFTVLMDDFGTGYSSLSILKDIEVDVLKIDMHFLEDSKIAGRGENIIASIIRMAKWLNIPTVAEGVEKAEQIEFLRSISCEYVQGFIFAKPMRVDEYEELVKNNQHIDIKRAESFDWDGLWGANPQMEILFSNATQATCLFEVENGHFEVLRANQAFHLLFHLAALEKNYQLIDHILPEHRADVMRTVQKSIDLQGFAECDCRLKSADQTTMWINMKLQFLNEVDNKCIIFASLFDITAQKNTEEELKKYKNAVKRETSETNKVIVVSNEQAELVELADMLKEQYTVLQAHSGEEALRLLREHDHKVDILLMDDLLSSKDVCTILEYKKSQVDITGIPIIKIVTYANYQEHEQFLTCGVNDLLMKPYPSEVLMRRVENVLASERRMREILKEYEAVLEQAQVDSLTQVQNRSVAERRIMSSLSLQAGRMHALILLDLDGFKQINDCYGHTFGDTVLVALAEKLKSFFRQSDVISRFGGDEFCVFMENISSENFVLNKSIKLCRQINELEIGEQKLHITCSMGVTVTTADACTFDTLYKNADAALCDSKYRGKNTVTLFGDEEQVPRVYVEPLIQRDWLLDELDEAIYLIDPESYELLYVSRAGLQFCHAENYEGHRCYELLYGRTKPCSHCIQDLLTEKRYYRWASESEHLHKTLLSKDKLMNLQGRVIHMRVATDISQLPDECPVLEAELICGS